MSEEVTIPGGVAVMRNKAVELSPRRRRPIEMLSARIGRKLELIAGATRLLCDGDVVIDQSDVVDKAGDPVFTGGDVTISEHELELVMRLNDAMAFALLESWTLDVPFPETEREYGEIPLDVFDALRGHAARIQSVMRGAGDPFSPDGVEDPASPTGG